jgi:AraC-like DNA-binding protein
VPSASTPRFIKHNPSDPSDASPQERFAQWQSMLFVPLPFPVAVLMLVVLGNLIWQRQEKRPKPSFLFLILVSALQSTLLGLRWGYGIQTVSYISPILAALVPPLVYTGVSQLVSTKRISRILQFAVHSAPALVIIALSFVWREALDLALILIFLGYAVAVLHLMRPGTDALRLVPLNGVLPVYRAVLFAAAALLLSAAVDFLVYLDFSRSRGGHVATLLSIGNLVALAILGIAAAAASGGAGDSAPEAVPQKIKAVEDEETIERINRLMKESRLYRDANLSLDRLARRALIPARQISQAINRAVGMNVSQYVNGYRIAEACDLLETTPKPVTEIMFDVGFQTKSNFNREFRRITEMAPQDWRRLKKASGDAKPTNAT